MFFRSEKYISEQRGNWQHTDRQDIAGYFWYETRSQDSQLLNWVIIKETLTINIVPYLLVTMSYVMSLKTALLTTLTSIKRVGDLQAFSVSEECLVFGPVYSHVVLRPRPGYVPKVPTTPFRDQVVNLQALPSEEADPALALLCPVRALRIYVTRTRSVRSSEQLFVCHGGQQKGKAVSKQRLAHWIVEAVALAYQSEGEPCPLGVRAHSTRSVASSHALAHGASLADICRAASWATPNTFASFYNLSVFSQFLPVYWVSNGREELAGVTLTVPFSLTQGIRAPFSPPVQFPGWWTLVESPKHPRQSDWAVQSDATPSTGVSSPGSPVSPCTGLGVRMAWFPFG